MAQSFTSSLEIESSGSRSECAAVAAAGIRQLREPRGNTICRGANRVVVSQPVGAGLVLIV